MHKKIDIVISYHIIYNLLWKILIETCWYFWGVY